MGHKQIIQINSNKPPIHKNGFKKKKHLVHPDLCRSGVDGLAVDFSGVTPRLEGLDSNVA